MKKSEKNEKNCNFLIGCITQVTYKFRRLLYLILKGIRLWKKEYGSDNMGEAVSSIMTQRNMYRRRYRTRE